MVFSENPRKVHHLVPCLCTQPYRSGSQTRAMGRNFQSCSAEETTSIFWYGVSRICIRYVEQSLWLHDTTAFYLSPWELQILLRRILDQRMNKQFKILLVDHKEFFDICRWSSIVVIVMFRMREIWNAYRLLVVKSHLED